MRLAQIGGCLLVLAQTLWGQATVALPDRQEVLFEGRVLRRTPGRDAFQPVPEFPMVRPALGFTGPVEEAWDGSKVYHVGSTKAGGRMALVGTRFLANGGEYRWFWAEPKALTLGHEACVLLGAWDDSLLFLQTHLPEKGKPASTQQQKKQVVSQRLCRVDLITGEVTPLLELPGVNQARSTALVCDGAFYVFTAAGSAFRLRANVEPWGVDTLSSNFWKDAGLSLCKDTGEYPNPFLFGRAFLDGNGSILIPVQALLPLDREDIDLAWSKLSQARKDELIRSGLWPVHVDQEIGWKDEAGFLKYDPSIQTFTRVDRLRFEHLVVEKDANFKVHPFREIDPSRVFTTHGEKILLLAETQTTPAPVPASSAKEKSKTPTIPMPAATLPKVTE